MSASMFIWAYVAYAIATVLCYKYFGLAEKYHYLPYYFVPVAVWIEHYLRLNKEQSVWLAKHIPWAELQSAEEKPRLRKIEGKASRSQKPKKKKPAKARKVVQHKKARIKKAA